MSSQAAAVLFLGLIAAAALGWMLSVVFRRPLTPAQNLLMLGANVLTRFYWRTSSTPLVLPADRGAVIACNHRSSIDPIFVQRSTLRGVYWMVAREFVEHPAFRWFLKSCAVIPVGRAGSDTAAIKTAMRHLQDGDIVGMFPEGRINMSDNLLLPGRPGAAHVAIKTRSYLVPCYIAGAPYRKTAASPLFMPTKVHVRFGEAIDTALYADRIEAGENDQAVTNELLLRVLRTIASLAGQAEFEPTIAGRNWKPTAEELAG